MLEVLCTLYWPPLYAFIQRQGYVPAAAEDLPQAFVTMLLKRGDLIRANPNRGRFRAFLLTALKHFLLNARKQDQALKRAGGRRLLSLDFSNAEGQSRSEPPFEMTPEVFYSNGNGR